MFDLVGGLLEFVVLKSVVETIDILVTLAEPTQPTTFTNSNHQP